jgi:hypothetical protein
MSNGPNGGAPSTGDEVSVTGTLDNMLDSTVAGTPAQQPVTATQNLNGLTAVSTEQLAPGHYKVFVEGGDNTFSVLIWKASTKVGPTITVPVPGAKGSHVLAMRADEIERIQIDQLPGSAPSLQFVWLAATVMGKTNLVYFVQLDNN